ncbi:MAG: AI-2E family transporter [Gammaproteobacteria bacterium]|nr:AI-2E family transporter [Gammaproteobacteria bacterium]
MRELLHDFYERYFHDEESVILVILLVVAIVILLTIGGVLAPLIMAIVIAYLLQGMVANLLKLGIPQTMAFALVYALFIGAFMLILLVLLPQLWNQFGRFINELPRLINQWQAALMLLPETYPSLLTERQLDELVQSAGDELAVLGQNALGYSIASIPTVLSVIVFIVLVPILVFFVMKDKDQLMDWSGNFLPRNRPLMTKIWREMDLQLSNYIRGKALEIFLVGSVSFLVLSVLGLDFALLLSALVGLSVVIPYIGATVVTIPIVAVAFVQWGVGPEFYAVVIAYGVIQLIDGNVLVPVIFSETNNLHPVAIITAVLVFGGIWGLVGVFFAIPLATFIKAIINAWPSKVQSLIADGTGG